MANKLKTSFKRSFIGPYLVLGLVLAIVSVVVYSAYYMLNQRTSLQVGAAAGNAELFFEPENLTLNPTSNVNLWVTTDRPTAYLHLELTFDPKVVNLSNDVIIVSPEFKRVIKKSSLTDANSTGRLMIVVAVDPSTLSSAPSGTYRIATLPLIAKVTTVNLTSTMTFDSKSLQFVDTGAIPMVTSTSVAQLTLNPVAVASSTPTPTPTPTPDTVSSDTESPTVSIISPQDGETLAQNTSVTLTANASDNIGVSKVEFYVDGKRVCTDTTETYSCGWKTPKRSKTSQIKATVYDLVGNASSSTVTVITTR